MCLFLLGGLSVVHAQTGRTPPPTSQSQVLRNAAEALDAKQDYDGANEELKQAYALDKTAHFQDAATDLNMIGVNEIRLGQYDNAVYLFQQTLLLRREVKDRAGEADTLNNLGTAYYSLNQYDKAIDFLQQALPVRREMGDRVGEAQTLNSLGAVYNRNGQYDKAIDLLQQELLIQREVKDRAGEAVTLNNLGGAYDDLSQYDKAIDYYQQALLLHREVGNRAGEATTQQPDDFLEYPPRFQACSILR